MEDTTEITPQAPDTRSNRAPRPADNTVSPDSSLIVSVPDLVTVKWRERVRGQTPKDARVDTSGICAPDDTPDAEITGLA